jgi:hypothetical protein
VKEPQIQGIRLCLPKKTVPVSTEDYRPIVLLNADYKQLTRVIAQRLRPWMCDILHPNQYCGRQGQTIFEAVAAVRDIIAYAEVTEAPLCVLTMNIKEDFDRISQEYLFLALQAYGFSEQFRTRLRRIYANATSTLQMNAIDTGRYRLVAP